MKRRISFILALLILAGSMSCGSGSGDKTQDTTASDTTTSGETTAEEVLTDGVPDIDMDGFVFSVFSCLQIYNMKKPLSSPSP